MFNEAVVTLSSSAPDGLLRAESEIAPVVALKSNNDSWNVTETTLKSPQRYESTLGEFFCDLRSQQRRWCGISHRSVRHYSLTFISKSACGGCLTFICRNETLVCMKSGKWQQPHYLTHNCPILFSPPLENYFVPLLINVLWWHIDSAKEILWTWKREHFNELHFLTVSGHFPWNWTEEAITNGSKSKICSIQ